MKPTYTRSLATWSVSCWATRERAGWVRQPVYKVEPHLQVWPGSLDSPFSRSRKQRELPGNRLESAGPSHNSISNISILFRICSVLEQQHHHIILWVCFCMVPNKFPQTQWFFYSLLFDLLFLEGKGQVVYFTSITISLLQLWLTFFNRFSINSENCLNRLWRLPWLPGGQKNIWLEVALVYLKGIWVPTLEIFWHYLLFMFL